MIPKYCLARPIEILTFIDTVTFVEDQDIVRTAKIVADGTVTLG